MSKHLRNAKIEQTENTRIGDPEPETEGIGDEAYEDPAEAEAEPAVEAAPATPPQDDRMSRALESMTTAVSALVDRTRRLVPFHAFRTRSPFNPTGNPNRKLRRRCYQNGLPMFIDRLTDTEIRLMDQIKPGIYLNGVLRVAEVKTGSQTDLHFLYSNKGRDQAMRVVKEFGTWERALARAIAEGPMSAAQIEALNT